jgi:hypothetical protein
VIWDRFTIAGENITLKENESHNRHEGRAFGHAPSNGIVAQSQPSALQGSECQGSDNHPYSTEDLRNRVLTTTRCGDQEKQPENERNRGADKATVQSNLLRLAEKANPRLSPCQMINGQQRSPFSSHVTRRCDGR